MYKDSVKVGDLIEINDETCLVFSLEGKFVYFFMDFWAWDNWGCVHRPIDVRSPENIPSGSQCESNEVTQHQEE